MTVAFVALDELCDTRSGGTPSKSNQDFWSGFIPWVSPKDMKASVIKDSTDHISETALQGSAASLVPANSILAVVRSGVLAHTFPVAITQSSVAFNQDIRAFIPKADLVIPDYLFWFMRSKASVVIERGVKKGATVHSVISGFVEKFQVPVPSKAEQRRIIDLLSRAEGIVRLRSEAQAKAAELIPALFLDIFGDPASNPKGWDVVPFGDVIGFTRYGPRFPNREYSESLKGGRVLRTTDIKSDGAISANEAPTLPMTDDEIEKYSLEPNTIVITRTGATIGKVALYEHSDEPAVAGAYLIEVRLNDQVLPKFMLNFLMSQYGQQRLTNGARAVAQPNLNVPTISAIPVPVPPLDLQHQFVAKIESVGTIVAQQATALTTAQATFDALLHRAFASN